MLKLLGLGVLGVCGAVVLSSCMKTVRGMGSAELVNTKELDIDGVKDISLSYAAEKITVFATDADVLTLKEYMSEDNSAYYARVTHSGDEIEIKAGARPLVQPMRSYIELYLPKEYHGSLSLETLSGKITTEDIFSLDEVEIRSTSGALKVSNITARELELKTVSGKMELSRLNVKKDVSAVSTSGAVNLEDVQAEEADLRTASGAIRVRDAAARMRAGSQSGSIHVEKGSGCGSFSSTSGALYLDFEKVTGDISAQSVSGTVHLAIPIDTRYRLAAGSTSGRVSSELEGSESEGDFVDIKLKTTSGAIRASYR